MVSLLIAIICFSAVAVISLILNTFTEGTRKSKIFLFALALVCICVTCRLFFSYGHARGEGQIAEAESLEEGRIYEIESRAEYSLGSAIIILNDGKGNLVAVWDDKRVPKNCKYAVARYGTLRGKLGGTPASLPSSQTE